MSKTNKSALVVIDVQKKFKTALAIEESCADLVNQAIRDGENIFLLEYIGFGESLFKVSHPASLYGNGYILRKDGNDGSERIHTLTTQLGFAPDHFKICGIYASACVLATVNGLSRLFSKSRITVSREAVKDDEIRENDPDYDVFLPYQRIRNVEII